MRQRAALARTLAVDPQVLLLDEPFSALDAQTKMVLQQDLAKMLYEKKKTALFITHDLVEAIALSDRLLVMSERPGTIVEEIEVPAVPRQPAGAPQAARDRPLAGTPDGTAQGGQGNRRTPLIHAASSPVFTPSTERPQGRA